MARTIFAAKSQEMELKYCAAAIIGLASSLAAFPSVTGEVSDTTRVVNIDEIVVIASPKENYMARQTPASISIINKRALKENHVDDLKGLSNIVPNFFMPDYGSRLTSAIYIRGIGSRINTPAVGLYVDNVPYVDKSAFDFNFYDIERVDVLRGPQGTLYGRNTMGGLIRVHTRSPFDYQGTDLRLSAGSYNNYSASVTHYHRISERFAFSAGGFYRYGGGYFENTALHHKADRLSNGGGRVRAIVRPNERLDIDMAVTYDHNNQGGYAYAPYDKVTGQVGQVATNEDGHYDRDMVNASVKVSRTTDRVMLSSVTGYQYLKDRMFLDQDFTTRDIYTLEQRQRMHNVSEELVARSNHDGRYQWTTGAFFFHQSLNTNAPVTFKRGGLDMIEQTIADAMSGAPVSVKLLGDVMPITGSYDTPVTGAAVYHQSTIDGMLTDGLSLTLGLRLDYERMSITHSTHTSATAQAYMMGQAMGAPIGMPVDIDGSEDDDYLKLLPKVTVKYAFKSGSAYATISRGYRSGGYNVQMFSDIAREKLMQSRPGGGSQSGGDGTSYADIRDIIRYKPEQTWNYEAGTHLDLFDERLDIDVAAFYMQTTDQQIALFAPGGFGRMTVNSGKSRSAGVEASVTARPARPLTLMASYGYTNAQFTDYATNVKTDKGLADVNYDGNFIPMVPQHTLHAEARYTAGCNRSRGWVDKVTFGVAYNGAGRIYFTETNDVKQDFYGTLDIDFGVWRGNFNATLWLQNVLDADYRTFYFETIGETMSDKAGFFQRGKPFHFGIDIAYSF